MAKLIFVNLPVGDLARATAFYEAIGAEKNAQFSDATASCMVLSDTIYVMLLTHEKFRQFTPKRFMYGRSFEDPDGHIWEVMWMDVEAAAGAQMAAA